MRECRKILLNPFCIGKVDDTKRRNVVFFDPLVKEKEGGLE